MSPPPDAYRIGIDIGGTFTDIVGVAPNGDVHPMKVSSTPDDFTRAIVGGLGELFDRAGIAGGCVAELIHGTTVASNAILERRGARTGLITTKGFRDALEMRRLRMPRLYDIAWEKPPALVERRFRLELDERVNATGAVLRPIDEAEAERALDRLLGEGIEALAVCLINSYANPVHERTIAALAHRRAPSLPVSVSSDVLPEIKEYERTSTTVINAYVTPVVRRYLGALRREVGAMGVAAPLLIMQSNGGLMGAERAAAQPMHIIESGPAAGVIGAQALARRMALSNVITFDMGGTTAKASMIEDGRVARAPEYEVGGGIMVGARLLRGAGYLLRVPSLDLAEVGAGGGSVVQVDAGGSVRVGPRSAGAVPGPVCYDRGGAEPTITDASVILGYLNPRHLAGGAVTLNAAKAHEAFARLIAAPLAMELADAAYGAYQVAVSNMIRAIKAVSSERGRDPRKYVLCAFGGNGPLFAAAIARHLSMPRVAVPPVPGLFSSFGLLCSDVEHHFTRTYLRDVRRSPPGELHALFDRMEGEARAQLASEGFGDDAVHIVRSADLRYPGQTYELTVPLGPFAPEPAWADAVAEAFAAEHDRTYGHRADPGAPVEFVGLRVVARGVSQDPRMPHHMRVRSDDAGAPLGPRRAYFGRAVGWRTTPVLRRADLERPRAGPCIIEEYDATCLVPPGARAALGALGSITIDLA